MMKAWSDKERQGRCFQLAYQYILNRQEGTLIHAEVYSRKLGLMIVHALVEVNTLFIYEPVVDRIFWRDELYHSHKVRELARYTVKEALDMALKTGTYGPWVETNNHEERR